MTLKNTFAISQQMKQNVDNQPRHVLINFFCFCSNSETNDVSDIFLWCRLMNKITIKRKYTSNDEIFPEKAIKKYVCSLLAWLTL